MPLAGSDEAAKRTDSIYNIVERKCPECGKKFFSTGEWVYRFRDQRGRDWVFCSWTCYRAGEKKRNARQARKVKPKKP